VGNQITADIPANRFVNGGQSAITVGESNSASVSSALAFTILGPQPTIASVTPGSVSAGNAGNPLDVAVTGTNFDCSVAPGPTGGTARTKLRFNGIDHDFKANPLATRVPRLSPSHLEKFPPPATFRCSRLRHRQAVGSRYPALAHSESRCGNPVPTITTLLPTSATAGGAAFTLTVNGTNFVSGAVVNFNGAPKTTTLVNATQITAAIAAPDVATAGQVNVTVTNPAPGGGTTTNQFYHRELRVTQATSTTCRSPRARRQTSF